MENKLVEGVLKSETWIFITDTAPSFLKSNIDLKHICEKNISIRFATTNLGRKNVKLCVENEVAQTVVKQLSALRVCDIIFNKSSFNALKMY